MERRTIWVRKETYEILKMLKVHPRETFDEVIQRLLDYYSKYFERAGRADDQAKDGSAGD